MRTVGLSGRVRGGELAQPRRRRFSWEGICCNDALSQIDIRGVGRDIFWPPGVWSGREGREGGRSPI